MFMPIVSAKKKMKSFSFLLINSFELLSILCVAYLPVLNCVSSFQSLSDGTTIISNQERFALGFFQPENSQNRYLGIWFNKIPVQTVVWVANRCDPIHGSSGLLTLTNKTHLVLLQNETVVWSATLLGSANEPVLELLDTGNLVVREDKREKYLWQSFDHPCDTLLPDMKLGWDFETGLKRELSAWKNPNDPCPGKLRYGFEVRPNSTPEIYIWKGKEKYYRSGPWNGLRFSGVVELMNNPLYDFIYVFNEREVFYMYRFKVDIAIFARVVLNETTSSRERYAWIFQNQSWGRFSSAPVEECDKYGFCGANGNCVMSKKSPRCNCLKGFEPRLEREWDLGDWSSGCVRKKALICEEKQSDEFVKITGLKLPCTTSNSSVNPRLNMTECKARCLENCSCWAFSNSDIRGGGSGCIMWFGDLMDIRQFASEGQSLFLRLPASELGGKLSERKRRILIIVVVSFGVFGLLLVGVYIYFRRTLLKGNESKLEQNEDLDLPLFDFSKISIATEDFSEENKLGEGGFGPVYKGTLQDGQEIAVKRLSKFSGQGLNEFKNEVKLIAKLQHRNLVRLLGCCLQGEEKLLIYEYMPNKSLDFFIFDEEKKKLLDWPKRFEIICGVARGILYLHQDSRLRIIHRDLKTSNVLLDSEMIPKISDFGMAKTFGANQTEGNTNRVVGTYGYMAPEYASDGLFSVKSDVFSFGIMMLEIISGKKNRGFFNPDQRLNLTGHAWKLWQERNSRELIDEQLLGSFEIAEAIRCIQISLLCVQQCPEDRPSMSSVVLMLGSHGSLAKPKQPGFFIPRSYDKNDTSSSIQESSSTTNELTISKMEGR